MEHEKRHCWECRRRRLVCDFARPGCNRCARAGIVCPEYGDTQPVRLKWLDPAMVRPHHRQRSLKKKKFASVDPTTTAPAVKQETPEMAVSPRGFEVQKPEELMLFQAAEYYNTFIGPTTIGPILEIVPTMGIAQISAPIFQKCLVCPEHIKLFMVCTSLGHRMSQNEALYSALGPKFYHYRGLMISSLRDNIQQENDIRKAAGYIIAGILSLLLLDTRIGVSDHTWRCHLEGTRKIIRICGGIRVICKVPGALPLLHLFMLITILCDTSSPAPDLSIRPAHIDAYNYMINRYSNDNQDLYITFPSPLFTEVIKINYLRMRAAKDSSIQPAELTHEAYDILDAVANFSPKEWAKAKCTFSLEPQKQEENCLVIGNLYKSAVTLYAMSALQSVSVLPIASPSLRRTCTEIASRLEGQLRDALAFQKFQKISLWPLVVLGVEAVHAETAASTREFVQEKLVEISPYVSLASMLKAKAVLERFWASGKTCWDDCFDEPYMFWTLHGIDGRGL